MSIFAQLQEDAVEQCRMYDQKSTLFRFTQAELDSVVLHMNNGEPIVSIFLLSLIMWRTQSTVTIPKAINFSIKIYFHLEIFFKLDHFDNSFIDLC